MWATSPDEPREAIMKQRLLILITSAALALSTLAMGPVAAPYFGLDQSTVEARGGGKQKCEEQPKGPGTKGTSIECPDKGNPHNSTQVKGNTNTLKGNNAHNECLGFNKGQCKK